MCNTPLQHRYRLTEHDNRELGEECQHLTQGRIALSMLAAARIVIVIRAQHGQIFAGMMHPVDGHEATVAMTARTVFR